MENTSSEKRIINVIEKRFPIKKRKYEEDTYNDGLIIFDVTEKRLRLAKYMVRLILITDKYLKSGDEKWSKCLYYAKANLDKPAVIFIYNSKVTMEVPEFLSKFIFISREEFIWSIERNSKDEIRKKLGEALVRGYGYMAISPYRPGNVVTDNLFFGRTVALEKVESSDSSFLLYGVRRVGKTSLLRELERRLVKKGEEAHYIHCANLVDINQFVIAIMSAIKAYRIPRQAEKIFKDPASITHLESVINYNIRGKLTLLLDETDTIMSCKNNKLKEIANTIIGLRDSGVARFVLAGYKGVHAARGYHSPLFNIGQPIKLKGLDTNELSEMISNPLKYMGITDDSANILPIITQFTSNLPFLLQWAGDWIVQNYIADQETPKGSTINRLIEYEDLSNDVIKMIEESCEREELAVLFGMTLLFNKQKEISKKTLSKIDIYETLAREIGHIDSLKFSKTLNELETKAIIKAAKKDCFFNYELLPEILNVRNGDDMLKKYIKDIFKSGDLLP